MSEARPPDEIESDDDIVLDDSVNIDISQLIDELEAECSKHSVSRHGESAKRRLERLMEERLTARELMDFDDYDLD